MRCASGFSTVLETARNDGAFCRLRRISISMARILEPRTAQGSAPLGGERCQARHQKQTRRHSCGLFGDGEAVAVFAGAAVAVVSWEQLK